MRISDWSSDVLSSDLCRYVPPHAVPVDEVIPARWRSSVIDEEGRVNRISYELCVLAQLRDRIRSKAIWVVGADRYRNPEDDLPTDFDARREEYYTGLNLTADEIGRARCRERVCQYVYIAGVAGCIKKKKTERVNCR